MVGTKDTQYINNPGFYCWFGLGTLVAVRRNIHAAANKDMLANCVLKMLWQQFSECIQMSEVIRCPHN